MPKYLDIDGLRTLWAQITNKISQESNATAEALEGKADLVEGKIPTSQLPSYVDDVLEYANKASFPTTGESGKIYIAQDTNKTYRWGGSAYAEISASLALGTTSTTAYRGDRGNSAYKHAVTNKGAAFAAGLYKITTNSEGHVTAATAVAKADITGLGIPAQDTTYSAAGSSLGLVKTGGNVTINDGIITVNSADSAEALTSSAGSASLPVYFNSGKPAVITSLGLGNKTSNSTTNITLSRKVPDGTNYSIFKVAPLASAAAIDIDFAMYDEAATVSNRNNFRVSVNSIYPATTNTKDIGSANNKWANIYATTFHGALDGNATTATNVAWSGVTSKPSYYDAKAIKSISRSGTTFTATHLDGTTSTFTQQDNNTTYDVATTSAAGLMSAADKTKLDGITGGTVEQLRSTSSSWRTLLSHYTATTEGTNPGEVTNKVYYNEAVSVQPSTGTLRATAFKGSGASLTSLNASNISSGTIAAARLPAATTSAQGAMTADMVTKLNGIAEGANKYTLPTASSSTLGGVKIGSGVTISSGVISVTASGIGAAPTSHASTATTYGAASASKYGHAMASSTTPKALGTAAVGSETAKFARGDHVHALPALTSCTGTLTVAKGGTGATNAATAISNLKGRQIFTSYSQLGLTQASTSYEIWNALPNDSSFIAHNSNNGQVTDVPIAYGIVQITKTSSNYGVGYYSNVNADPLKFYNASFYLDRTFDGWKQVITEDNFTDNKVTQTLTEDAAKNTNWYLLASSSQSTGTRGAVFTKDLRVQSYAGTTSVAGEVEMIIGNSTASGTAGNKEGFITLYSKGSSYHMIKTATVSTGITHTLPAKSGTILNTGTFVASTTAPSSPVTGMFWVDIS